MALSHGIVIGMVPAQERRETIVATQGLTYSEEPRTASQVLESNVYLPQGPLFEKTNISYH
jgi:hypothetical protein